jgi:hypothetical protein
MHSSKQITTGNNCIIPQAQNTITLHPNAFLTGIHWLLVTKKNDQLSPAKTTAEVSINTRFFCTGDQP